jgi:hypothetical protein
LIGKICAAKAFLACHSEERNATKNLLLSLAKGPKQKKQILRRAQDDKERGMIFSYLLLAESARYVRENLRKPGD